MIIKIFLTNELQEAFDELPKTALDLGEFNISWNLPYLPIPGDALDWVTFLSPEDWKAFTEEQQQVLSQISNEESWVVTRQWQLINGVGVIYIEIGSHLDFLKMRDLNFLKNY